MNILHITSWYPTNQKPKSAIWVNKHVQSLEDAGCQNKIYHLEVGQGNLDFSFGKTELLGNKKYSVIAPVPWIILEFLSFFFLGYILWMERRASYDIINFHIAYPNLTYWHWIKKWIKVPVVITEHWSAYHDNFGLENARKLPRIQRIFANKIPVISVSNALLQDIKNFSVSNFSGYVVPNVVDTSTFRFIGSLQPVAYRFFMVSQWKAPKDPFTIISKFKEILKVHPSSELRIGGYGSQLDSMKGLVSDLSLDNHVVWLGTLNSEEIASEMNLANTFIHISGYETFSVVCAEAACCGCPVMASNVGGIPEFIDESNGVLIDDLEQFVPYLLKAINKNWSRQDSGGQLISRFNQKAVGKRYLKVLSEIVD